jgi:hypothetical protein
MRGQRAAEEAEYSGGCGNHDLPELRGPFAAMSAHPRQVGPSRFQDRKYGQDVDLTIGVERAIRGE